VGRLAQSLLALVAGVTLRFEQLEDQSHLAVNTSALGESRFFRPEIDRPPILLLSKDGATL
jgi:hypothetical protein